jgi:hypothetical protein
VFHSKELPVVDGLAGTDAAKVKKSPVEFNPSRQEPRDCRCCYLWYPSLLYGRRHTIDLFTSSLKGGTAMILVRDIFQLKFGKTREAKELWKEGAKVEARHGYGPSRAMVDLVGPYYTMVTETTFESLTAYENAMKNTLGTDEFRAWYQKFVPLVESGRREIYTVLE